jgi:hypothetical protein
MNSIVQNDILLAQNHIKPHLLTVEGDVVGMLFTGSRVEGHAHPFSDYDICCLTSGASNGRMQNTRIRGLPCELFFHSEKEILEAFNEDISTETPVRLYMYKTGVIIHDPEGKMQALKRTASEVFLRGLPPLTRIQSDQIRHNLETARQKLMGLPSEKLPLFLLGNLMNMQRDWYALNRYWRVKPAIRDNFISSRDPVFYKMMVMAFNAPGGEEKKSVLLQLIDYLVTKTFS